VNADALDLEALPLRFSPPDGWRMPSPQWISLYQGAEFPRDWQPYPDAPPIPPSWPWWEENGTSWFRFFRERAPLPARALGNWFSLAALGLFMFAVSPFALPGWFIAIGGVISLTLIILGVRGVIKTLKKQPPSDLQPLEVIRLWATERRVEYYSKAHLSQGGATTLGAFIALQEELWWGENAASATS
jgi:hypothetical protein